MASQITPNPIPAAHVEDYVPEYMRQLRNKGHYDAYRFMQETYSWDIAQQVTWQCLATNRTERVNGAIYSR